MRKQISIIVVLQIVILILIAGFFCFRGLDWGLPDQYHSMLTLHPDEGTMLAVVSHINPKKLDFNPNWMYYPNLPFYIYGGILYAGGKIGLYPLVSDEAYYMAHPESTFRMYLICRSFNATCGVISVLLLFWFTLLVLKDRWVAFGAALILAMTPMFFINAHYMTVDIPLITALLAYFISLFYYHQEGSLFSKRFWLTCVLLAVTTAYKYPALVAGLPLLLVYIFKFTRETQKSWYLALAERKAWYGMLTVFITFFILSPYTFLDWGTFTNNFGNVFHAVTVEPQESSVGGWRQYLYHLLYSLPSGLGPVMLITAIGGLIFAMIRREFFLSLIITGWVVFFFTLNCFPTEKYVRYLLPMVPFMALLVALFWFELSSRLSNKFARPLLVIVILLFLAFQLIQALAYQTLLITEDSRTAASNFITHNIPIGTSVSVLGNVGYTYPPALYDFENVGYGLYKQSQNYPTVRDLPADWLVLSESDINELTILPEATICINNVEFEEVYRHKRYPLWGSFVFQFVTPPADWQYLNPEVRIYRKVIKMSATD